MNRLYMWESIILITSYLLCLMIEKKYMYTIVEGESGEKLRVMGGGGAAAAQRINRVTIRDHDIFLDI